MKQLMFVAVLMVCSIAPVGSQSCGIAPVKPIPPIGCKDLVAQCSCVRDKNGMLQCQWVWVCVPNK